MAGLSPTTLVLFASAGWSPAIILVVLALVQPLEVRGPDAATHHPTRDGRGDDRTGGASRAPPRKSAADTLSEIVRARSGVVSLITGLSIFLLALLISGNAVVAFSAAAGFGLLAWVAEQIVRFRRRQLFADRLIPSLGLLANSLRAA